MKHVRFYRGLGYYNMHGTWVSLRTDCYFTFNGYTSDGLLIFRDAFRDDELELTPVEALALFNPERPHLDAIPVYPIRSSMWASQKKASA